MDSVRRERRFGSSCAARLCVADWEGAMLTATAFQFSTGSCVMLCMKGIFGTLLMLFIAI